jgi:Peptidase M50B-like
MVLTAAAGYLTPPLLGAGAAVLLFTHHVTLLLWAFLLLAVCFLAMRNAYGVLVALVAGGAVFAVTAFASALTQALFSYRVAWFLLFGGLRPVVELARSRRRSSRRWRGGVSDADQLARLTGVPGGVWVGVFAVIALVAIVVGARLLVPPTVHVPRIR